MSETSSQSQPDEAMVDLLVKQVTEGLSPAEQRALDVMDGAVASVYLRDLERAVAAVSLAAQGNADPLPAALWQRLIVQAEQHAPPAASATAAPAASRVVPLSVVRGAPKPAPKPGSAGYGWLAAAACLLLAVLGWLRQPGAPTTPVAAVAPPPVVVTEFIKPPPPPTPAEARASLLAKSETLKITLGPTKDSAAVGVTGDVVWDPATQQGYLHFVGLASNDPSVRQYQLWIFDGGRDKRYPVDGGVFDVPANASEVVIPIRAALPVLKLAAFAVTVERPGGAVVSGRDHVVALGAAG